MQSRRASTTTSTGGAGTLFEQHVDATFLSLLLVRGIPPVLTDCNVVEVDLQAERLGYSTDDVLVVGTTAAMRQRRLLCQTKLGFTVSAADEECTKAIVDFWRDFHNQDGFSESVDRFALITLRGTNVLGHFSTLLENARASRDAAEFQRRLATPGLLHATAKRHYGEIRAILDREERREVAPEEVWRFLKLIHVLSYDLNTASRQTEAIYKTLLAHSVTSGDPLGAADETWNSLLLIAGEGMAYGTNYRRENLPQELQQRHSSLAEAGQNVLRALADHSALILGGIRTSIGPSLHLPRERSDSELRELLEANQIVIVTGPAGSGKSGVAKHIMSQNEGLFSFAFRAEEFAGAHLDSSLHHAQIPANAVTLGAILAGQSQKLLLVESVERLLEASTRDAFTDLLTLLKADRSWRLILTCRDYSTDLVRSSLLGFASAGHEVLEISPLTDEELSTVETALPPLARPLAEPRLRGLLRNPYILDKASQMDWSRDRPLPEDERAFRNKFWSEIVRKDAHVAGDLPRRRQNAFVDVALRRARALTQFVSRDGLDAQAVNALHHDSLLSFSEETDELVAPSHDVLEDWAILRWIDEQFALTGRSLSLLAPFLGAYPAIRRSYRKWVSELVERDPAASDSAFDLMSAGQTMPAQFRDDTLVSLLRSAGGGDLLNRHASELFANGHELLRRVIHLLRVGCVTTPAWFGAAAPPSLMHVPDGAAWVSVLDLVATHLSEFSLQDFPLLLGLIEDASRGVSWNDPYPNGSQSISEIAYWMLPQLDGYRDEEQRKKVLQIIAKLPNCNLEEFRALLLNSESNDDERNRAAEDLRRLVLGDMHGFAASRETPETVIAALREELLLTEDQLAGEHFRVSREVEGAFGITFASRMDSFPSSAYRGTFLHLLRCHPRQAIDFLLELLNYSATWYGEQRLPLQFVEPPEQVTLTFADGTTQSQWSNGRLWNLYRGTSVGPYVLQSALMALEHWLLAFGEARPQELDALLAGILKRSETAAITSVVASVATAFPRQCPETLLTLLSCRDCILLDRARMAQEPQARSINSMLPGSRAGEQVFTDERTSSNAKPHRRHDLEAAIANVQMTANVERVQAMLDAHRNAMPPVAQQDENDRVWRLALHRMDLRQYTVSSPYREPASAVAAPENAEAPAEPQRTMVRLDLGAAEPDVQEMVERSTENHQAFERRIGLLMWGIKVFEHASEPQYDPAHWHAKLTEAIEQDSTEQSEGLSGFQESGPEFVATVCIRDHFDEISPDELQWCIDVVCDAVLSNVRDWSHLARCQRYSLQGDRPAAFAVCCLMGKQLDAEPEQQVRTAFACAVLHPIDEVRAYAAAGIGQALWANNPGLVWHCINAIAAEARQVQEARAAERARPFQDRMDNAQLEYEFGVRILSDFYQDFPADEYARLDIREWNGADANLRILNILSHAPEDELTIAAFRRTAEVIAGWWERSRSERADRQMSMDTEIALPTVLEQFVLKVPANRAAEILEPIINAVDLHPDEVSRILQGIVAAEDRLFTKERFWQLWQLFAARVRTASWLPHIDREHAEGASMMAAVFLTQYWKDETRHWRSVEGHAQWVADLFNDLPATARILDNYVRFLYHIGEQSLPDAFILIAHRLQAGIASEMLHIGNTVYMLEELLRRYVYGRPLELKQNSQLRDAVLYLLDTLIECGSSSAFQMRDDFVTPAN